MDSNINNWKRGIKDGVPIFLGYFAVSFTFGIVAKNTGLTSWEAALMSAVNLTSAGQFAALSLISISATYLEMAITQFIINLRYFLMSCSLSQKLDPQSPFIHRLFIAFGVTDEIFAVAVRTEGKLNPFYSYGLMTIAIPGWVGGTILGVVSGNILPANIVSALSVALYAMFLALIIPPAKGNRVLSSVILLSMLMSFLFSQLAIFSHISAGSKIIILTILIAGAAAVLFPIKEQATATEHENAYGTHDREEIKESDSL